MFSSVQFMFFFFLNQNDYVNLEIILLDSNFQRIMGLLDNFTFAISLD